MWLICLCLSDREDKCDAMEELQEELDAVKQSEERLRIEVGVSALSHLMLDAVAGCSIPCLSCHQGMIEVHWVMLLILLVKGVQRVIILLQNLAQDGVTPDKTDS